MARGEEPRPRPLRTLFGEHVFHGHVYGRDLSRNIDFRPIDVRLQIDGSKYSPRLQEISQLLCVEQSFEKAGATLDAIFGQRLSVSALERVNRVMAAGAEEFLYEMAVPAPADEGEILVVSGDAKGVPMVREPARAVPAFEKRGHPGNRRMATLAAVYSVDRYVRTPEQIVAALFREEPEETPAKRPAPVGKAVVGHLTRLDDEGEPLPGDIQAFAWAAGQVELRHRAGQPLVRLMDGQASLWETATICLGEGPTVDILDIIHVSTYVWTAAKVFHRHREQQEAFARDRLERILRGEVGGVIKGMREQATKRTLSLSLSEEDAAEIERVCAYFGNNRHRMRYGEYLREGYPIATGVIEGACRHLVADRMCRTGMRWELPGAQAMLHLRAIHQAGRADEFHADRARRERDRTRSLRNLLKGYTPFTLCG